MEIGKVITVECKDKIQFLAIQNVYCEKTESTINN